LFHLGAVCLAAIVLTGIPACATAESLWGKVPTQGAASAPSPSVPLPITPEAKSAPVVPATAATVSNPDVPVAAKKSDLSNLSGVVQAPKALETKTELQQMKDEFAALMKKRAGIEEKVRESMERIGSARSTTGDSPSANSATAKRYRDAAMAVEKALDKHPQIVALHAEIETIQKEKVELSMQQGEVIGAWKKALEEKQGGFRKMVEKVQADAEAARQVIYKRAGVTFVSGKAKEEFAKLSDADNRELEEITKQVGKNLVALAAERTEDKFVEELKEEHEKDGSAKRFEELTGQVKALDAKQGEVRAQKGALRASLRESDPAIAALQGVAFQASQEHLVAAETAPETVAAKKFIAGAEREKAQLDRQARALRKTILAREPEYKNVMDRQAFMAGLKVDESFWKIEG
jgi:hypothetical protein